MAGVDHPASSVPAIRWKSVGLITTGALALYVAFRFLPTGTNLHHMDFQVSGAGALEMCDPANPQFIPVVEARSPVRAELSRAPSADDPDRFVLRLSTAAGKPIAPEDLLTVHTRKLHLLVIDETLSDYRHVHPEPGDRPGEWVFSHRPARSGLYRVFADFTPAATARGVYSFADYTSSVGESAPLAEPPGLELGRDAEIGRWRFRLLTADGGPVRAGRASTLIFSGRDADGGAVPLTLVMDAYAHLVAFDAGRSGFAHLHPRGEKPGDYTVGVPDLKNPRLYFDLTISAPGRYVVWAQVNLEGIEHFMPFALNVGG